RTALVGILENGSLPSLYVGLGAVLCRTIPHFIIKFYIYERLKHLLSSSAQSNAHPSTIQMVCFLLIPFTYSRASNLCSIHYLFLWHDHYVCFQFCRPTAYVGQVNQQNLWSTSVFSVIVFKI
ncbi:hypothetical protein GIB67_001457, partial [Kingdonia uniflora]